MLKILSLINMLFLIIFLLSYIAIYFMPWWVVAIISFIAAFFLGNRPAKSFWSSFVAVFLAWAIYILLKTIPNDNILASRVIKLFPLPNNWVWLLVLSSFIGGFIAGMSAISAIYVKLSFQKITKKASPDIKG
jgi:hypothetical protein